MHMEHSTAAADFFYVPVYGSCNVIYFNSPSPRLRGSRKLINRTKPTITRVTGTTILYEKVYEHLKTLPYWQRHAGADHIMTFAYDEGACFAPKSLVNVIKLVRFANTNIEHKGQFTSYPGDRWSHDKWLIPGTAKVMTWTGPHGLIGDKPCYESHRDIAIPTWKILRPSQIVAAARKFDQMTPAAKQQFFEEEYARRKAGTFFFAGDLGSAPGIERSGPHSSPEYSQGIRQNVTHYFRDRSDEGFTIYSVLPELSYVTRPDSVIDFTSRTDS
ncbi:hypothetical protein CYMTET_4075 [Cymbomonas tetramitiformis]|uniref:Exostosin GT47 domain-containing protein n=1 Tax=Cymbomonas tetramitiformis TaxID=36881 RepID=A0AAE0H2C2_9CHLO|nr:hypothetical protein CYMTET_4075 [Cymbomonas tetramitiformis]